MLQPVRQALVRHSQPSLDSAQRLVQPPGDLTVGEPLEIGQRYHASLLIGKRRKRRMDLAVQRPARHRRFVGRGQGGRRDVRAFRDLRLAPALSLPPPAAPAPQGIEGPVACDPQYPRHQWSSPGVVLIDVVPDLHEYIADDLLGLVLVVQDAKRNTEDPGRDEIVQLREGVLVPGLESPLEGALRYLTKTFWGGHLDSILAGRPRANPAPVMYFECTTDARADGGSLPVNGCREFFVRGVHAIPV